MRKIVDIQYSEYDETLVDLYLPETGNFTTVVNFHGGGLDHGSKASATMEEMALAFTNAGYALASVEFFSCSVGAYCSSTASASSEKSWLLCASA